MCLHEQSSLTFMEKLLIVVTTVLCVSIIMISVGIIVILNNPELRKHSCVPAQRLLVSNRKNKAKKGKVLYEDIIKDDTTAGQEFKRLKRAVVSINRIVDENRNFTFCVGSIIAENWVVTSSVCLNGGIPLNEIFIRAGSTRNYEGGTIHHVQKHFVPNSKRPEDTEFNYDTPRFIALIKIKEPFVLDYRNLVALIVPPHITVTKRFTPDYRLYTVGWGTTLNDKNRQLYQTLKIFSSQLYDAGSTCSSYLQLHEVAILQMKENVLCAGDLKAPSRDQCNVDVGAPLTHLGVLHGVSWSGMSCKNFPTVYTKIALYSSWLYEIISNSTL